MRLALPLLLVLAACNTVDVDVAPVAGMAFPVLARHDAYVANDPNIAEADRASFLAQSSEARVVISAAEGKVDSRVVLPLLLGAMARHDAYIASDDSMPDADKATYLRSTELLRLLLGEASMP